MFRELVIHFGVWIFHERATKLYYSRIETNEIKFK